MELQSKAKQKKFHEHKKGHMKGLILQKAKNFQEIRQYDDNIVIFLSICTRPAGRVFRYIVKKTSFYKGTRLWQRTESLYNITIIKLLIYAK